MSVSSFSPESRQPDYFWGFSSVALIGAYAALRILDAYSQFPVVSVEDGGEDVPVVMSFQFIFLFWSLICRSIDQLEGSQNNGGELSARSLPTRAVSLVSLQLCLVTCSLVLRHDFLRVIGLVCGGMMRVTSLCFPDSSYDQLGAGVPLLADSRKGCGSAETANGEADDQLSCWVGFKDNLYRVFALLALISEAVRDQPDLLVLAAALNVESFISLVRMLRDSGDHDVSSVGGECVSSTVKSCEVVVVKP